MTTPTHPTPFDDDALPTVQKLHLGLDALDTLRERLGGQRDACCNEVERWLVSALDDLELRKPSELTDAQELMARLDALGLAAYPWHAPSESCPADLRRELDKVTCRAAELKALREQGRWNP
jgi:hypothetical protein